MSDDSWSTTRRRPTQQDFIPKKKYPALYSTATLRGDQDERPWDLQAEILRFLDKDSILLDVGCGPATKLVGLAPFLSQIFAVDPSPDMRLEAERNFALLEVNNGVVLDGEWAQLPIRSESISVVTSMLAGFVVEEVVRVLKPGGTFILETIGPRDQVELKTNFGSDEHGPRGQYLQFTESDFLAFLEGTLRPYFLDVKLRTGFWDTYHSVEGLQLLLSATPIVRDFDIVRDKEAFLQTVQQNMTSRGIKTTQNRVLVICTGRSTAGRRGDQTDTPFSV